MAHLQACGVCPWAGWGHFRQLKPDNLMGSTRSYSDPCPAPSPITESGNLKWQVPIRTLDHANRMCLCAGDNESKGVVTMNGGAPGQAPPSSCPCSLLLRLPRSLHRHRQEGRKVAARVRLNPSVALSHLGANRITRPPADGCVDTNCRADTDNVNTHTRVQEWSAVESPNNPVPKR